MRFLQAQTTIRRAAKSAVCFALALALLIGSFLIPAQAGAEETGTVSAKVVLRKTADKESKALQTLPEGEEVVLPVSYTHLGH